MRPRDEARRTGRSPYLPPAIRRAGPVPGDHWLERRAMQGMDPCDLAEDERLAELERRERLHDYTPVSGLFRIGEAMLVTTKWGTS